VPPKAGSIHAAARDLELSQPAVSKSLRTLEEKLAAPLLIRSINGVEPTDYGKVFNQRAQIVIDELRKAQEDVVQLRGKLEGSLTVAIAPASRMQLAPMALKIFEPDAPTLSYILLKACGRRCAAKSSVGCGNLAARFNSRRLAAPGYQHFGHGFDRHPDSQSRRAFGQRRSLNARAGKASVFN
jgi:molybdenum-dependent DNA-binding transcriptional regulator ModE